METIFGAYSVKNKKFSILVFALASVFFLILFIFYQIAEKYGIGNEAYDYELRYLNSDSSDALKKLSDYLNR